MNPEQPGQRHRLVLAATTVSYGPRFLYPTAELREGAAGKALIIRFPADPLRDLPIPDEAASFEAFLALGVEQALREAWRRFIRFHPGADLVGRTLQLPEEFS
jgi:hypothetical protein